MTRNGKEINHIGLTPDVEVENTTDKIDTSKYTPFDYTTKQSVSYTHLSECGYGRFV